MELRSLDTRLADYEGLIRRTSQMFAARAGMEEDDFAQELWLKVWRAAELYNPARARGMPEHRYVYSLMFNRVKDMLRYPRKRELLIGDIAPDTESDNGRHPIRDSFERRYLSTPPEEVVEAFESQGLIPGGLPEETKTVLLLLYLEYQQVEIAPMLGISLSRVKGHVRALREHLEGLRPEAAAPVSRLPERLPQVLEELVAA